MSEANAVPTPEDAPSPQAPEAVTESDTAVTEVVEVTDTTVEPAPVADAAPAAGAAAAGAAVAGAAATAPPPPPPAAVPSRAPISYDPAVPRFPDGKPAVDEMGQPVSTKSRLAAALLCWFLGFLGIHRFYVNKIGTGVLMIVTLGGLGIWVLIDLVMILVGSFRDKDGLKLYNW